MKINYVVMSDTEPHDELRIDNNFPSEEAAEAAIAHYFENFPRDYMGSPPILWIKKTFQLE